MEKLPTGSKISGSTALLVIICFFLPWISVSCLGSEVMTMSGWNIAIGGEVPSTWGPVDIDGYPLLFVTPIAAILICLIFYWQFIRGRAGIFDTLAQMAMAVLGFLMVLLVVAIVRAEYAPDEGDWIEFGVQVKYGFFGTVFGLAGVVLGGLLALPELLRGNGSSSSGGRDDEDYNWDDT